MQQHGGEERAEYLQELERSDPRFYVPPVNGASFQTAVSNDTSKQSSLRLCSFSSIFNANYLVEWT